MEKRLTVRLHGPAKGVELDAVSMNGSMCLVVKDAGDDASVDLQPGDVLVSADDKPIVNLLVAKKALRDGKTLGIQRSPKMAVVGKRVAPQGRYQKHGRPAHHNTAPLSQAHHGAPAGGVHKKGSVATTKQEQHTVELIDRAKAELASTNLLRERRSSFSVREKHMRLFISSSFVDMRTERDLLMKHVFPKVRSACSQLGAQFTEIDLRWGIDEQSQMPKVIATCLSEVTRCRPFILCIIGQRYGWQPPKEALEEACGLAPDLRWTLGHSGLSITHMEAMEGILRLPEEKRRGLVYMRSPDYLATLEKGMQQAYSTQDPDAQKKLEQLKRDLRNAGGITVRTYNRPEDLPQMVMEDLLQRCQSAFAQEALTDPYQQDNFSHNAFGASRAATYIPFPHLEAMVAGILGPSTRFPVLIRGESGTGKSSIMAAFLDHVLDRPQSLTFFHFIGHSSHSAHHVNVLKRLLHQLKQWAPEALTDPVPHTASQLIAALPSWLSTAASAHQDQTIFICLDALNQLQSIDNAHTLFWLPRVFPKNVNVVLSSTPCSAADVVAKRGWDVKEMPLIGKYERVTYALIFLQKRGKDLSFDRLDKIVSAKHVTSLLHLRLILEELQVIASFDTLDTHIPRMLAPQTLPGFFGIVLDRLEKTYNSDLSGVVTVPVARRGIVGSIMCYVACARHGITETELMAILGVARSQVSTLMFAVEEFLQINTGYLLFAHEAFLKAVEGKYLRTDKARTAVHAELAAFFTSELESVGADEAVSPAKRTNPSVTVTSTVSKEGRSGADGLLDRVCAELPWHLLLSHQREALCAFLTRIPIYRRMRASEFLKLELASFWRELDTDEASARYGKALESYLQSQPDMTAVEAADTALAVAAGLHEWGEYTAAEQLYQKAQQAITDVVGSASTPAAPTPQPSAPVKTATTSASANADADAALPQANAQVLAEVLVAFARLRTHQSRGKEAQALLRRARPIFVRMFGADSREVTQVLDDLAWNLIMDRQLRGQSGAVALLRQSLQAKLRAMYRGLTAAFGLDALDVNQDLDAQGWVRVIETLEANPKQTPRSVPPALNRLALAYSNLGHMRISERLFSCSLLLHRSLWGDRHPHIALVLGDLGSLYARQIAPQEMALAAPGEVYLYDAQDSERGDAAPLDLDQDTLFDKAKKCYEEALDIRTETLGREHPFTATSLKGLGDLLCRRARVQDAVKLYKECHAIRLDTLGESNKQTQLVASRLLELGHRV